MNNPVQIRQGGNERADLKALDLHELFLRAEAFGNLRIHSSRGDKPPNCYAAFIEFDSIPGTSVEAKSDFRMDICSAVIQAVDRAERIVENYSKAQEDE